MKFPIYVLVFSLCLLATSAVAQTKSIPGSPASFDTITAGTSTGTTMTVGTGSSIGVSGSGTVTATSGDSATAFFTSGTVEAARLPATTVYTIASDATEVNPTSIASGACNSANTTATATGVASTDVIVWTPNADISAVTGYTPATTGGVIIYVFPTTNTVNFRVCNPTADPIDPGSITINWRVER